MGRWVLGLIVTAALILAAPAAAATNGRIAFSASTGMDGTADIATVQPDGTGWKLLTAGNHEPYCAPAWSPDGKRIAFVEPEPDVPEPTGVQSGLLHVMNADGGNRRVLALAKPAPDCTRPSWSPDGAYIAYQGFDGTNFRQVYAIRANGAGAPIRVTNDDEPARMGAWSPDGSKILYASEDGYLYATPVTRGPLGLTFGAPTAVVAGWMGTTPDWSPDGTRLATGRYDSPELRGIWTIDSSDGGNPQQVTSGGHFDTEPAWSPDGTTIAFGRSLPDEGSQLFHTAAGGGGEPVRLTQARDGYIWFFSPDWQPRP